MYCITITQILLHMTLLFLTDIQIHYFTGYRYFIYLYHCYMDTLYTVISCYTWLLHKFTSIHVLIISVFLLHGSLFILHELLLHRYFYIPFTWLFSITDIDIPVTGHVRYWYVIYETKCHVDLSHGGHL